MITIREADLEADALAILEAARNSMSRINGPKFFPEDDASLVEALGRVLSLEGLHALVAEVDGEVVGGIGIHYAPYLWNPGVLAAEQVCWWAHEGAPNATALLLIRAAFREMRRRGAGMVTLRTLPNSSRSLDKLYRRMGLAPYEMSYRGAL